jgi:hypothetical protein
MLLLIGKLNINNYNGFIINFYLIYLYSKNQNYEREALSKVFETI